MPDFKVNAPYEPTGDQPAAISGLAAGIGDGLRHQVLLGATGTGKTYTAAKLIESVQKPTLVMAHNKTLAAQLYQEFRSSSRRTRSSTSSATTTTSSPRRTCRARDTYIEKDSSRNDEIDRLRHNATRALFERRDVIIVASVSCIYGIGAPVDYGSTVLNLKVGGRYRRDGVLRHLVDLQYQRNDMQLARSRFRVRGDVLEFSPVSGDYIVRVDFFGDEIERIVEVDDLTGEVLAERREVNVYPASHYVTPRDKLLAAITDIEVEMEERTRQLANEGRELEAARLRQRTHVRPRDDARGRVLLRDRELLAAPRPARGRLAGHGPSSTTSRPTSCWSWTRATSRSRRSTGCTRTTAPARRSWSTSGSGCRPRSTTGRSPSRSSRTT